MAGYTTGQANPNIQQLTALSPEFSGDAQDLARSQRLAQMLTSAPAAEGQMISGRYVAPSWSQNLNQLVQAGLGAYYGNQADEQQTKLAERLRQDKMGTLEAINTAIDAGDMKKARAIATSKPEYAKEFIAPLLENTIAKKTPEMINYEAAKADPVNPFKGSFNEFKNQMTEYQRQELALKKQAQANELGGGKPTEAQSKAGLYRSQMIGATNELNNLYAKGFDPSSPVSQAQTGMAGGFLNIAASPEARQAKQAQNQWSEAYLRFKTGAGTNASEIELNRKTYFPTNMDDADTIALKARMRQQAEQDMGIAAGPTARLGVQPIAPTPKTDTPAPKKSESPSLWGPARVVTN
jgi:hypothetical protein